MRTTIAKFALVATMTIGITGCGVFGGDEQGGSGGD